MADSSKGGIFSGLRILDLTQYVAGPLACKLMSDLGAEVIKLELAPRGDMMRYYGPPEGQCTVFLDENRGKRSVGFDLKRPEGAELMRDLVRGADVLVENWTPGVLAKYGVSLRGSASPQSAPHHVLAFGLWSDGSERQQAGQRSYRAGGKRHSQYGRIRR